MVLCNIVVVSVVGSLVVVIPDVVEGSVVGCFSGSKLCIVEVSVVGSLVDSTMQYSC